MSMMYGYPHSLTSSYGLPQSFHQRSSLASMYSGTSLGYTPSDWATGLHPGSAAASAAGLLHRDRREYLSCSVNPTAGLGAPTTAGYTTGATAGGTYPGLGAYSGAVPTYPGVERLGATAPTAGLSPGDHKESTQDMDEKSSG